MDETTSKASARWHDFYSSGSGNTLPDENIVRLIKGTSYADMPRSGRAIDIGFGRGATLMFLSDAGFETHGLEVSQASVKAAEEWARSSGRKVTLGLIDGPRLSYDNGFFDLIVSWNAVYYFGSRSLVHDALKEFRRVLAPGGAVLLSVIHPNSNMVRRLRLVDPVEGTHEIESEAPWDNRKGLEIFYEPTSTGWRKLLSHFGEVEEGFIEVDLFAPDAREAWRLFLARGS